jgi:preprotein translocase subunit SecD
VSGDRNVLVQLPGVTDRTRALNAVGSTGQLSFRQVLEIGSAPGVSPILENAAVTATDDGATITADPESDESAATTTEATTTTTVPIVVPAGVDPSTGITIEDDPLQEAWLVEDTTGFVYHVGPALVLGADITGASAGFSGGATQTGGTQGYIVDPDFTSEGSAKFEDASKALAAFPVGSPQRAFAIVLDGNVVSAPQVAAGVTPEEGLDAGSVIITVGSGEDQATEAEDLATVLRYGALPVTFERLREESVSATLGDDSLRAGLVAGLGGLILVAIAMVVYYRALGLVTVVGLSVFGSILVVIFSLLGEFQGLTLTLAGVAGIIVSIGITSDSYIVYFERIKEEVRKGRTLRSAVDHAFGRAFRTILTADTVSFTGAVLLWLIAIGPVRGFAIALGLATVTDVVVAYFYTRPATAFLVRTRLGEGGAFSIRGAVGHHGPEPAEAEAEAMA